MRRIHARCSPAKVRPCSGCTTASASTLADDAIVAQRTTPAAAWTIRTPAGCSRARSGGPNRKNTSTSATTDSDQRTLAMAGVIPAALQRITAKVSCIARLPSIRLATSITRRNSGMRSSVTTPDGGARSVTAGRGDDSGFGSSIAAPAAPASSAAWNTVIDASPRSSTSCPLAERADDEERGSGPADPAVFESRPPFPRLRRAERERIGECRGRRERRGLDEADQQERREARCPQEANRDDRSLRLTAGECGAKRLGQVGEAPDQRAGREPDRRPGADQERKLLGREPALLEKCRHERRGHAECRVHERVESDEPK